VVTAGWKVAKLVPGENDLGTLFPEEAKEADSWEPRAVMANIRKSALDVPESTRGNRK